ncbi:MAG TPA: class I SAM-dependent methyltransferase [Candidatus Baltobacteraceae bacterium]|nr:class I SAM-dependent methyltransferase [Candidatus Baltobacteraceae bacterium]
MNTKASPWKLGDFHVIGAAQITVGEWLCDDLNLTAGHRVLDVACGSGNTALAAARRNNRVTGLDLVEALVERAKARTEAEGFEVEYVTGNAEDLPFDDDAFDVVLSTFGVMFAPNQEKAASELVRVCKPGGRIGLANWTPESLPGAMFRINAQYVPPPVGTRPAIEWGTVPGLQRLFGDRVRSIELFDRTLRQSFISFDHWLATFRTYFGPVKNVFDSVDAQSAKAFEAELRENVMRYNRATDGTLSVAMSYVNVLIETR